MEQPTLSSSYHAPITNAGGNQFVGNQFHGPVQIGPSRAAQYLRELNPSNPRVDKRRILDQKDDILSDACAWIWDHKSFRNWLDVEDSQILWLHGDAGKGKTMMAMFLIDKIEDEIRNHQREATLGYFFCQSSVSDLNNGAAVLKGLINLLATEDSQMRERFAEIYEKRRPPDPSDHNFLYALWDILLHMLDSSSYMQFVFVIDALDECDHDIEPLLRMVKKYKPDNPRRVKWLLTSRNEYHIEKYLEDSRIPHVSLEIHADLVQDAISRYISSKVDALAVSRKYDIDLKNLVESYLRENAEGTFLWVALVCKELERVSMKSLVRGVITTFPRGLHDLYNRMLRNILREEDESLAGHVQSVLRLLAISFRPRKLEELVPCCDFSTAEYNDMEDVNQLVQKCRSFVVIREDSTISFVHQSAKEFFQSPQENVAFSFDWAEEHAKMARNCLTWMSKHLRRDVCSLGFEATRVNVVPLEKIKKTLPLHVQYACVFWIDHLSSLERTSQPLLIRMESSIHSFLTRFLLEWFEALSLLQSLSTGLAGLKILRPLPLGIYQELLQDARIFLSSYFRIINTAPLQVYTSALVFSPRISLIRRTFGPRYETEVSTVLHADDTWNPKMQTFDYVGSGSNFVVRCSDQMLLIANADQALLELWDMHTSMMVESFLVDPPGYGHWFSTCGNLLAVWSKPYTEISGRFRACSVIVHVIDTAKGNSKCKFQTSSFEGFMAFSSDTKYLATRSGEGITGSTINIWSTGCGTLIFSVPLNGFDEFVAAKFVPQSDLLAVLKCEEEQQSSSTQARNEVPQQNLRLELWDLENSNIVDSLTPFSGKIASGDDQKFHRIYEDLRPSFLLSSAGCFDVSSDGKILAIVTLDSGVSSYHIRKDQGRCTCHFIYSVKPFLEGPPAVYATLTRIGFSPDGSLLVTTKGSMTRIFEAWTGKPMHTLIHVDDIESGCGGESPFLEMVFSPDQSKFAISIEEKGVIQIFDLSGGPVPSNILRSGQHVTRMQFAADNSTLVYQRRSIIDVCDVERVSDHEDVIKTFPPLKTLGVSLSGDDKNALMISGRTLAPGKGVFDVVMYDTIIGKEERIYLREKEVNSAAFSPDGSLLALATYNDGVTLVTAPPTFSLRKMSVALIVRSTIAISPNNAYLAVSTRGRDVKVFNIDTLSLKKKIGLKRSCKWLAFSHDSQLIATANESFAEVWDVERGKIGEKEHIGDLGLVNSSIFSFHDNMSSRIYDRGVFKAFGIKETITGERIFERKRKLIDTTDQGERSAHDGHSSAALEHGTRNLIIAQNEITHSALYGLDDDLEWITYKRVPFLWLPPQHRPKTGRFGGWDSKGRTVATISESGRLTFIHFRERDSDMQ